MKNLINKIKTIFEKEDDKGNKKSVFPNTDLNDKHIYLVDWENTMYFDYSILENKDNYTIIFVGKRQQEVSMDYLDIIYQTYPDANLMDIKVPSTGKNFLDTLLSYYCGRIVSDYDVKDINIITNDKDYTCLCEIEDITKINRIGVDISNYGKHIGMLLDKYNGPVNDSIRHLVDKYIENEAKKIEGNLTKIKAEKLTTKKIQELQERRKDWLPVVKEVFKYTVCYNVNSYITFSKEEKDILKAIQAKPAFKKKSKGTTLTKIFNLILSEFNLRYEKADKIEKKTKSYILLAKMFSHDKLKTSGTALTANSGNYMDLEVY